jgi:hypothetical protein
MLETEELPTRVSDLNTRLTDVNTNTFSLSHQKIIIYTFGINYFA